MKVTVKSWNAVAQWRWDTSDPNKPDEEEGSGSEPPHQVLFQPTFQMKTKKEMSVVYVEFPTKVAVRAAKCPEMIAL